MKRRRSTGARGVSYLFVIAAVVGCSSDPSDLFGPADRRDAAVVDAAVERDTVDVATIEVVAHGDGSADVFAAKDVIIDRAPLLDADAGVAGALCNKECESKGIGTCVAGECVIRCDESHGCSTRVVCPPGLPCRVLCASSGSCAGGVDCSLATQCDISCSGTQSCGGIVQCAGTRCSVGCLEKDSCPRLVSCSAKECELSCIGAHACAGGVTCLGSPQKCNITCGGPTSCAGAVQGSGNSEIRCSGFGSCATSVSCAGESCAILCTPLQSCGGSVCCQSLRCTYSGTDRRCL
jgi:hypothetical protein